MVLTERTVPTVRMVKIELMVQTELMERTETMARTEQVATRLPLLVDTGTYTQDGDTVILAFPASVKFSENWGNLVDLGYFLNSEGEAVFADDEISGDIVQCKEEESHVPFDIFPGMWRP